jgi:NADPH-dependent ferric siderophore reductase
MSELRTRREPPPFRRLAVSGTESVSARMTRVSLGGRELEGFTIVQPAASVRLLLPTAGELEIPNWNGNEFLLGDGTRPIIRTLTPRLLDSDALELLLDVVLHGSGAASTWAQMTEVGDPVAVSGPGRGYDIDHDAPAFLLAGDETAIPAICQLLEHLPDVPITVLLAATDTAAQVDLHREVDARWHFPSDTADSNDALHEAVQAVDLVPGLQIWAAGEAAAMQRIRKFLFREIGFPRSQAHIRGYWKRSPQ